MSSSLKALTNDIIANIITNINGNAAAIEAVCNITAQKVVLLGHSTGGLIAAHYLNQGPKRHMVDALTCQQV